MIKILEMVNAALMDNGKIDVTKEQLDQLQVFIFGYMAAAEISGRDKNLSDSIISTLDSKWESLFNIIEHNRG